MNFTQTAGFSSPVQFHGSGIMDIMKPLNDHESPSSLEIVAGCCSAIINCYDSCQRPCVTHYCALIGQTNADTVL